MLQSRVESQLGREPDTRTLEECLVAGVGRFTAFTDGSLRIVFDDRTCLDMRGIRWEPHVFNRLLSHNVVRGLHCLVISASSYLLSQYTGLLPDQFFPGCSL